MGLNSFIIKFVNNPNKIYRPGDEINGKVIIDLNSVKKINAIRIQYKGRTKTEWSQKRGKSNTYYHGKEIYFDTHSFIVQGNNAPIELPTGRHTYEFSFILPPVLPSSFNAKNGTIKYSVKVTMVRPWKFDQKIKNEFFINQLLDLNQIDFVKAPATLTIERQFCCCFKPGTITIKICVPCSGYICGQTVPFIIEIDNASNLRIDGFRVQLKRYHVFFTTNRSNRKTVSESLLLDNVPLRITASTSETYFHNITIPTTPVYNVNKCEIIDIDYKLKFKFILSGFHANVPGELPVMLGHIPLNYITPIEEINTALTG